MSDELIDLFRFNIPPEIIGCMPDSVARENRTIPIAWDDGLVVAMAGPDAETVEKLRFILNTPLRVVLATPQAIEYALQRYYRTA
jgi:hypothetical protein